jgi:hypothetical protein
MSEFATPSSVGSDIGNHMDTSQSEVITLFDLLVHIAVHATSYATLPLCKCLCSSLISYTHTVHACTQTLYFLYCITTAAGVKICML